MKKLLSITATVLLGVVFFISVVNADYFITFVSVVGMVGSFGLLYESIKKENF